MIVFLADGTGHQYAGWGLDQTPDGTVLHTGEVWLDPGAGSRYTWNFDLTAGSVDQMPTVTASTPGDLTTGLQVYFGADDDLDSIDGTVYTEPGIQIYEDPDPQASPGILSLVGLDQVKQALTGNGNDPYPLPALYLGTCGLVFGGGAQGDPTRIDGTPLSNSAGQIVAKTACN